MKEIEDIYAKMEELINDIEGEEAAQEVDEEYAVYDENTKSLLNASDMDDYMIKHEKMCLSQNGVLECFDIIETKDLKNYIEENNISFDELKIATAQASCEALENLIYEAEEDEY